MQDVSSADPHGRTRTAPPSAGIRAFDVPAATRVAMVALGFIPLLHVAAAIAPLVIAAGGHGPAWLEWLSPALLYLAPPLAVRLVMTVRPLASGYVAPASAAFLLWWFTAQCQVTFSRLPVLEEILRLVPGLYSVWLRLWGARIGSLVYWSPGVIVLDRSLLRVGDRVILGAGARLCPHLVTPDASGRMALLVGRISIGQDALIGAYSFLLPGCEVAEGEITAPHRSIHAFTRFERGRRMRLEAGPELAV
jgi:hypothetical protein